MELLVQPCPVPAAGVQVLVHHVAVVDEEHRQRRVLRRRAGGLRRQWRGLGEGQHGHLTAGLQDGIFDISGVAVALAPELLKELVHGEPVPGHVGLDELPVTDDDGGLAADQGTEADGFQAEEAQKHGQAQQRHDGEHPVDQRDAEVLHGHRRQVGDDQGQHQLADLQFPDLPLPHEPQPHHQDQV